MSSQQSFEQDFTWFSDDQPLWRVFAPQVQKYMYIKAWCYKRGVNPTPLILKFCRDKWDKLTRMWLAWLLW